MTRNCLRSTIYMLNRPVALVQNAQEAIKNVASKPIALFAAHARNDNYGPHGQALDSADNL